MDRRHVRIEYRLREDTDLPAYLALVTEFVANIKALRATNDYTAYRDPKDARHFVHVGHFDVDVVPVLQQHAWFKEFTSRQRELVVAPPDALLLDEVASTR
jgi:hypothetical protein